MRKELVFLASLVAATALAASHEGHGSPAPAEPSATEAAHGGEHEEKHDTATFIIHHLVDSNEFSFDIPLTNDAVVFHLPVILIPLKSGACPKDPAEASLANGCLDLSITKHALMMWIATGLLLLVFLLGSHRDRKQLVPRGRTANFLELLVLFVRDEMAIKNIGKEEGPRYTPYLLSIFFFILFINLWGLVPWMSAATGNIAVTVSLALCTFVLSQVGAIRAAGVGGYLKHLTGGVHWALWPIMIPVEFLGLFTKPFALTIRLFANMLAGHIIIFFLLGLIFILNQPAIAAVSVPFAMGIYFLELFVAFVQAYIFTMLSSLFIGMGVAMGHHGGHDAHDEGGHHVEGTHSHDHGKAHVLGS